MSRAAIHLPGSTARAMYNLIDQRFGDFCTIVFATTIDQQHLTMVSKRLHGLKFDGNVSGFVDDWYDNGYWGFIYKAPPQLLP
jgi:hypothetical protein